MGIFMDYPGLGSIFRSDLYKGTHTTKTRTACDPGLLTEKDVFGRSGGCGLQPVHNFLFHTGAPWPGKNGSVCSKLFKSTCAY